MESRACRGCWGRVLRSDATSPAVRSWVWLAACLPLAPQPQTAAPKAAWKCGGGRLRSHRRPHPKQHGSVRVACSAATDGRTQSSME
eukprot:25809-Chlamydomonas_euryale.AAC.1